MSTILHTLADLPTLDQTSRGGKAVSSHTRSAGLLLVAAAFRQPRGLWKWMLLGSGVVLCWHAYAAAKSE